MPYLSGSTLYSFEGFSANASETNKAIKATNEIDLSIVILIIKLGFKNSYTNHEVVINFLTILALSMLKRIFLLQSGLFSSWNLSLKNQSGNAVVNECNRLWTNYL